MTLRKNTPLPAIKEDEDKKNEKTHEEKPLPDPDSDLELESGPPANQQPISWRLERRRYELKMDAVVVAVAIKPRYTPLKRYMERPTVIGHIQLEAYPKCFKDEQLYSIIWIKTQEQMKTFWPLDMMTDHHIKYKIANPIMFYRHNIFKTDFQLITFPLDQNDFNSFSPPIKYYHTPDSGYRMKITIMYEYEWSPPEDAPFRRSDHIKAIVKQMEKKLLSEQEQAETSPKETEAKREEETQVKKVPLIRTDSAPSQPQHQVNRPRGPFPPRTYSTRPAMGQQRGGPPRLRPPRTMHPSNYQPRHRPMQALVNARPYIPPHQQQQMQHQQHHIQHHQSQHFPMMPQQMMHMMRPQQPQQIIMQPGPLIPIQAIFRPQMQMQPQPQPQPHPQQNVLALPAPEEASNPTSQ